MNFLANSEALRCILLFLAVAGLLSILQQVMQWRSIESDTMEEKAKGGLPPDEYN